MKEEGVPTRTAAPILPPYVHPDGIHWVVRAGRRRVRYHRPDDQLRRLGRAPSSNLPRPMGRSSRAHCLISRRDDARRRQEGQTLIANRRKSALPQMIAHDDGGAPGRPTLELETLRSLLRSTQETRIPALGSRPSSRSRTL